jgi:hypothetical protein
MLRQALRRGDVATRAAPRARLHDGLRDIPSATIVRSIS